MATLDSSNIVNNNVIQTDDLLQLYNALSYPGASPQYLVEISGSLEGTASFAETCSFALNGGGGGGAVTSIIAGTGITISPNTGIGNVTITSIGGGGSGFPYTGGFLVPAIVTGSLMVNGTSSGQNHALIVTGSMIVAAGAITGNLQGTSTTASYVSMSQTASYVSMSQTASYVSMSQTASFVFNADTSSKINVLANNSGVSNLPIVFASSNTAGTQQLQFDNVSPGPTINPSLDAISATSFTGSLFGQATQATNATSSITASRANTIDINNNISPIQHYLTFVDAPNTLLTPEILYTNDSLKFTPSTGILTTTILSASSITASSVSASSFTGSLLGTASHASNADKTFTTSSTATTAHYLTFVDSDNNPGQYETVNTNLNLRYIPSTAKLQITGSVSASSFTGSLLGTASHAVNASSATTSTTANQVKTITNATNAFNYLTFVDSDNASSDSEVVKTNSKLRFNPSTAILQITGSVSASSFTGSLLGTASYALNTPTASYALSAITASSSTTSYSASKILTTSSTAAGSHYLTFVEDNNTTNTATYETVKTNTNIGVQLSPIPVLFIQGTVSASVFQGNLNGTATNAINATNAETSSITLSTTRWYTMNNAGAIPGGRDVGVVFDYTGHTTDKILELNTSSLPLIQSYTGDQVRIATRGTYSNGGRIVVTTTGASSVSGSIIVPGITANPSTKSNVRSNEATINNSQSSWKFICVKGGHKAIWQLVNYIDKQSVTNGTWNLDAYL